MYRHICYTETTIIDEDKVIYYTILYYTIL